MESIMASEEIVCKGKTCDAGAKKGIEIATENRIETVWDRYEAMQPQCGFGELGVCCNNCLQGPCRINPFRGMPTKGICGARDYTIVARNLIRHIAGGAASHSGHGRHIAETLMKVTEGGLRSYSIKDLEKLGRVARRLGIDPSGLGKEELARKVVMEALDDYARFGKQPLKFTTSSISAKRRALLEAFGVIPNNIDHAISDVMHRSSLGCDADPIPLIFGGIACAVADYDGMQISTDLSDILFGTPRLIRTFANLGVLKADAVNIAIHGHNPVLSEVVVDVARKMNDEAKAAGASGINIVGICCTGNETLMRKGVSMAANFASQELALATGAVDLLVADYQCIMPSLSDICSCLHTEMVTTMLNVHIPFDTHVQFREEDAEESARTIVRMAIEAFKRRDPRKTVIPEVKNEVIAGFSLEQIEELCAKMVPEDPLMFLVDSIKKGRIRGIALMAGCNNQRAEQDYNHLTIAQELLRNDVLVLATGCSAGAFAKNGLMSAEATELFAGPNLKAFLNELSEANGVQLPPIWHMGSCVDNTRAMNLATALAHHFGKDVDALPFVVSAPEANHEKAVSIGTWCVAFGLPVHVGTINYIYGSPLVTEVLTNTARDVFGGHFIFEPEPEIAAKKLLNELERRRWKMRLSNRYAVEKGEPLKQKRLYEMAIDGAIIATGFADQLLAVAIDKLGYQQKVEFPETAYMLPSIFAWEGREVRTLADIPGVLGKVRGGITEAPTLESALAAGEATMVAAEVIEALRYISTERPYEGTGYCGFIPDKVLRELGIAFVDDTIPGAAVLVGTASDPQKLVRIVRDCQSKGMLIIASFDTVRQLQDEGIKMGLDVMLYPVGEFTQVVHGLNFAIRAALTFGNVQSGDRERLQKYLTKRPKVFVLQLGPIDAIKAAAEFAVLLNGSPTITDQDIEAIPDKFISQPIYDQMIQTAIELRGINVKLAPVSIPVAYGPAFEGETVRRPDTYIEAGGAAKTMAFELLRRREETDIEDGKITVIGKDVDEMPEGSKTALAIIVDVYGKKMQEDFESVLERRIHQYVNFAEGAWHTGQRNLIWVRLSKSSVRAGLRFKHFGDILITKIKGDFGNIVSRVQVTIITDEAQVKALLPEALAKYATRDERLAGLTDEAVDVYYTCSLCQSFAPDHICIVTPERLGLCGAINWLDAKASREIAPTGPNQPIRKGEAIDEVKGEWKGVNQAVYELSHGKLERFNAYTMMENPMTSCGCFEVIVAMTADTQGVILVNREFPGMTPVGMKFSTLAGSIGGGKQTPGFIGVGRKYILSKKFISADGGFLRIAWMPKELKAQMLDALKKRSAELGEPDFVDKIADETITDTAEGLMEWMVKVDHPALKMPPLLQ
jgi:acetyl-CoA synthase